MNGPAARWDARGCPGAVLDSTWFDYALPLARSLPGRLVEVHCTVPVELARSRYRARAGQRHAGHLDAARGDDELWSEPTRPLGLGPVVRVDTSGPVDIGRLASILAQAVTRGLERRAAGSAAPRVWLAARSVMRRRDAEHVDVLRQAAAHLAAAGHRVAAGPDRCPSCRLRRRAA